MTNKSWVKNVCLGMFIFGRKFILIWQYKVCMTDDTIGKSLFWGKKGIHFKNLKTIKVLYVSKFCFLNTPEMTKFTKMAIVLV